jgi:hypothetical protein
MDMNACKQFFNKQIVAKTEIGAGSQFIGTLEPIAGSASAVKLVPLAPNVAAQYDFAINGASALDVGSIVLIQELDQPHT